MAGYTGILHAGLAAGRVSIRDPIPGEQQVQHLEVGITTDDLARAQAGLPQDSFEKPFVLLPPDVTGASKWTPKPLEYRGKFPGGIDAYGVSIPLPNANAGAAALQTGVAFGLTLFGQTFWLQSPKTNLTPGPSNIRGLAGVTGAQTASGGTVAMRQDRTQDPEKSTLHFEVQDNKGMFQDGASIKLKLAISSAERFLNGDVKAPRTDRPTIELTRIGPNRFAGALAFQHGGTFTADPATSYSREIEAIHVLPVGPGGVSDGEGEGVKVR